MSFSPIAWLNGGFVPLSQASLSVLDAGVTNAATVTERMRTFHHVPFRLDEHLARLAASAKAAYIPLRIPTGEIASLVQEVVRRNAAMISADDDLAISVFATAGAGGRPSLCVHATPIPALVYADGYETGVRLVTPVTHAMPPDTLSPQIKTRSRLHWYIADAQADRFDPTAKALLLDNDGFVTETATANVFIVTHDGGRVVTPRRMRTLCGISQEYVLELLPHAKEADLHLEEILMAREVFLTSSVSCVQPAVSINRIPISDGQPGQVYRDVLAAWSNAVGVDIAGQMRRMADQRFAV